MMSLSFSRHEIYSLKEEDRHIPSNQSKFVQLHKDCTEQCIENELKT